MLICVYIRYIKPFYCIVYLVLFSMPMYFYVVYFCLCFYYWVILICLMNRIRGMLVAQVALCHLFEITTRIASALNVSKSSTMNVGPCVGSQGWRWCEEQLQDVALSQLQHLVRLSVRPRFFQSHRTVLHSRLPWTRRSFLQPPTRRRTP